MRCEQEQQRGATGRLCRARSLCRHVCVAARGSGTLRSGPWSGHSTCARGEARGFVTDKQSIVTSFRTSVLGDTQHASTEIYIEINRDHAAWLRGAFGSLLYYAIPCHASQGEAAHPPPAAGMTTSSAGTPPPCSASFPSCSCGHVRAAHYCTAPRLRCRLTRCQFSRRS